MSINIRCLFLWVLLLSFMAPRPCLAWGSLAHSFITHEAIAGDETENGSMIASASTMPDMIAADSTKKRLLGCDVFAYDYAHEAQPPVLGGEPIFADLLIELTRNKSFTDRYLAIGWKSHQIADESAHDAENGFIVSKKYFPHHPLADHGLVELAVDAFIYSRQPSLLNEPIIDIDIRTIHEASIICANDRFAAFPYPEQKLLNCPGAKGQYRFWRHYLVAYRHFLRYLKQYRPKAFSKIAALGMEAFDHDNPVAIPATVDRVSDSLLTETRINNVWAKMPGLWLRPREALAFEISTGTPLSELDMTMVRLTQILEDRGYRFEVNSSSIEQEEIFTESLGEVMGSSPDECDSCWSRFMALFLDPSESIDASITTMALIADDEVAPEISGLPTGLWTKDIRPEIGFTVADDQSGIDINKIEVFIKGIKADIEYNDGQIKAVSTICLAPGSYPIIVDIYDLAGNKCQTVVDLVVDREAPEVIRYTIDNKCGSNEDGWRLEIIASEPVAVYWELTGVGLRQRVFQCYSDQVFNQVKVLTIPKSSAARLGLYHLRIELADRAGNCTGIVDRLVRNSGNTRK